MFRSDLVIQRRRHPRGAQAAARSLPSHPFRGRRVKHSSPSGPVRRALESGTPRGDGQLATDTGCSAKRIAHRQYDYAEQSTGRVAGDLLLHCSSAHPGVGPQKSHQDKFVQKPNMGQGEP